MVTAVIAAYLYLKIVVRMYSAEPAADVAERPRIAVPARAGLALGLAFVLVIGLGVVPGPVTNLTDHALPRLIAAGK